MLGGEELSILNLLDMKNCSKFASAQLSQLAILAKVFLYIS